MMANFDIDYYVVGHGDSSDVCASVPELGDPNVRTYPTRTECVNREIVAAIEEGAATADEYDIDAIAYELVMDVRAYNSDDVQLGNIEYFVPYDPDRFWEVLGKHAKGEQR